MKDNKKSTKIESTRLSNILPWTCFISLLAILLLCHPLLAGTGKAIEEKATGGILYQGIVSKQNLISVKLFGVTRYELTELFHVLLKNSPGVEQVKLYRLRIEPNNPQVCQVSWQVEIKGTDSFQLESHLYRTIRAVAAKKVPVQAHQLSFRPSADELGLFGHVRPWKTSGQELEFILDWPVENTPKR